jgi:hypothetical protein
MIFPCGMHSFQAILNMVVVGSYTLVVSKRMQVRGIGLDSKLCMHRESMCLYWMYRYKDMDIWRDYKKLYMYVYVCVGVGVEKTCK